MSTLASIRGLQDVQWRFRTSLVGFSGLWYGRSATGIDEPPVEGLVAEGAVKGPI